MRGLLLDTNLPSEVTRPYPDPQVVHWLDEMNDADLYISVLSLAEILRGVHRLPVSKRRTALEQWLDGTLRPWFEGRVLPVNGSQSDWAYWLPSVTRRDGLSVL